MDQPVYHVMLEGRPVGPYDRRTIVGMRIKQTLGGDDILVSREGNQLTVRELINQRPSPTSFNSERSGSYSVVKATYTAGLVGVRGRGVDIPRFKGEMEARVQADVIRLAGHFRRGLGWKEDRVKISLKDVVHARVRNTMVDLWIRSDRKPLQEATIELFTPEAAGEFVDWLPLATLPPDSLVRRPRGPSHHLLWVAAIGIALVFGLVLFLLLGGRILR